MARLHPPPPERGKDSLLRAAMATYFLTQPRALTMHLSMCCLAGKDRQIPLTVSRDTGSRSGDASEQPCLLYCIQALQESNAAAGTMYISGSISKAQPRGIAPANKGSAAHHMWVQQNAAVIEGDALLIVAQLVVDGPNKQQHIRPVGVDHIYLHTWDRVSKAGCPRSAAAGATQGTS